MKTKLLVIASLIILASLAFAIEVVEIPYGHGYNIMGINKTNKNIKVGYWGDGTYYGGTNIIKPGQPYRLYGALQGIVDYRAITFYNADNHDEIICEKVIRKPVRHYPNEIHPNWDYNVHEIDLAPEDLPNPSKKDCSRSLRSKRVDTITPYLIAENKTGKPLVFDIYRNQADRISLYTSNFNDKLELNYKILRNGNFIYHGNNINAQDFGREVGFSIENPEIRQYRYVVRINLNGIPETGLALMTFEDLYLDKVEYNYQLGQKPENFTIRIKSFFKDKIVPYNKYYVVFNNNSNNKLVFNAMGSKLDVFSGQSGSIASMNADYPFKETTDRRQNHIYLSNDWGTRIPGCESPEGFTDATKNYYEITIDTANKCTFDPAERFKVSVPEKIINPKNNVFIHNKTKDPILVKHWWTSGIFGIRLNRSIIIEPHDQGYINAADISQSPVIEIQNNRTHARICNKDRGPGEKCEEELKSFWNRYIIDIESSGNSYNVKRDKLDVTPSVIFNNKSEQSLNAIVEERIGFQGFNKLLNHNDSASYLGNHYDYGKLYFKHADRLVSEYEIPKQCIVNVDLCRLTEYNITKPKKSQQNQINSEVIKKTVKDIQ